ncbi:MAG: TorF family putative porin [Verrucomicrobia bacterium]|nr:TorF family putative porin [Verrucomicrobiota bacterium]
MKIHHLGAVAAAALVCSAATVRAEDGSASAGADVVTAYIFRGVTINDDVNVQPWLEGSFYGVTIGTWANFNSKPSQFDEIDYYAGYDLPLEDSPVGLSLGYTEYTYPTAPAPTTDPVTGVVTGTEADREVSISASLDSILSPSLAVYFGLEGPFLDEGMYIELGLSHEVAVDDSLTVSGGATLGYEAGDNYVENGFSHLTLSLGASMGALAASVNYVVETDDKVLVVGEDFYGSVGISLPL